MVKIKEIKKPKVKELKSSVKVLESKNTGDSLESEIESAESERENGFIAARATSGDVPLIRQVVSRAPVPADSSEETSASRVRELPSGSDARPASYTPRSDAEIYTALSTQNASARYTMMHGEAKADERLATRARVASPAPSLGPRAGNVLLPHDRFIGQPLNQNEPSTLRSAWQDDTLDRRYDMYREDSLQESNKPRRVRR